MWSDSSDGIGADWRRGILYEMYFADACKRLKVKANLEYCRGEAKFMADFLDRNTGHLTEVKQDDLLGVSSKNVMFELYSNVEHHDRPDGWGWGLRYLNAVEAGLPIPRYIIFVNGNAATYHVCNLLSLCSAAKSAIPMHYITEDVPMPYMQADYLRNHLGERGKLEMHDGSWVSLGVKGNGRCHVLLMDMDHLKAAGHQVFLRNGNMPLTFGDFMASLPEEFKSAKDEVQAIQDARRFVEGLFPPSAPRPVVVAVPAEKPQEKPVPPPPKDAFVHLHVHSQYSILDGVPDPEDIVARVAEIGQPAVALTDHGYMFGNYKFQSACAEKGIKAIHGVEAYYCDDVNDRNRHGIYHLILLAMNQEGWRNLCALVTAAGRDGFFYKPRLDAAMLASRNAGLICSLACYRGPVAFHMSEEGHDPDKARAELRTLKSIFGDRLYNEVMHLDWPPYDNIVPKLIEMANQEGLKTIVTNDAHYVKQGDNEVQGMLLRIATGGKMEEFEAPSLYIKTREEMIRGNITPAFADNTLEVASRIEFELKFSGYKFPRFDITTAADHEEFKAWLK